MKTQTYAAILLSVPDIGDADASHLAVLDKFGHDLADVKMILAIKNDPGWLSVLITSRKVPARDRGNPWILSRRVTIDAAKRRDWLPAIAKAVDILKARGHAQH